MAKQKKAKYPWDKWLNRKKPYVLRKGEHFKCKLHAMNIMLRRAATSRGKTVSVEVIDRPAHLRVHNIIAR